jgi:hypothetical protein
MLKDPRVSCLLAGTLGALAAVCGKAASLVSTHGVGAQAACYAALFAVSLEGILHNPDTQVSRSVAELVLVPETSKATT